MTSLLRHGNESGDTPAANTTTGTVTTSTAQKNTGTNSWLLDATAATSHLTWNITTTLGRTYFTRMYVYVGGSPAAQMRLMSTINTAGNDVSVRMNTDRTVGAFDITGTQIGSNSATLGTGTWHYLELAVNVPTTAVNGTVSMKVNGTTVVNAVSAAVDGSVAINRFRFGKGTATTITTPYMDDIGVNDDQGAAPDNTFIGATGGGGGAPDYTTILTHGNESTDTPAPNTTTGTVTTVTTPVNEGTQAWQLDPAAAASNLTWNITTTNGRWYYMRGYFRFGGAISAEAPIMGAINTNGGNFSGSVRLSTGKTVGLYDTTGTQVGSSSAALADNTWHYIEMAVEVPTTAVNGRLALKVNGTSVVAFTSAPVDAPFAINRFRFGKNNATTITSMHMDSLKVNEATTESSTAWPGATGGGGLTPVTVNWISPTPAAAATISGNVGLAVSTSDDTLVSKVEFFRAGSVLLNLDSATPWSFTWDSTSVADGSVTITAKATMVDNQTVSITRTFTVDNVAPAPTLYVKIAGTFVAKGRTFVTGSGGVTLTWLTPDAGASVSGTVPVNVSTSNDSQVTKIEYINNATGAILDTQVAAPYDWNWNTSSLPVGPFTMKAKATLTNASTVEITRTFNVSSGGGGGSSGAPLTYSPPSGYAGYQTVTIPTGYNQVVNLSAGQDYRLLAPNPVSGGLKVVGGRNVVWIGGEVRVDYVGTYANFGGSTSSFTRARMCPEFSNFTGHVFVEGLKIGGTDNGGDFVFLSSSATSMVTIQNCYVGPLVTRAIQRFTSPTTQILASTWPTSYSVGQTTYPFETGSGNYVAYASGRYWDTHVDCFQSWQMPHDIRIARISAYTPSQFNFFEGPQSGSTVTFAEIDYHPITFNSVKYLASNSLNKNNSGGADYTFNISNVWCETVSELGTTKSNYTATYSGSAAWEANFKLIGVDSGYNGPFVDPNGVGIGYVSPGYI